MTQKTVLEDTVLAEEQPRQSLRGEACFVHTKQCEPVGRCHEVGCQLIF